ncbi:MAG: hypothetical protein R8G66_05095 [Cytophagales bacterium]|nr:hypothetical protein [Cytophagales bacterium]
MRIIEILIKFANENVFGTFFPGMNIEKLNQAFVEIAEKKIELTRFDVQEPQYDAVLAEIHTMEENFQLTYGTYVEEVLFNVHDEYCPDNEVLLPSAYMASAYLRSSNDRVVYDVENDQGIIVEADDFPGVKARLVLIPGPTRLILQGEKSEFKETVWIAS